jgi:hypothetical protein
LAKYSGVVFKKELGWGDHVASVTRKGIKQLNFVMRQLKGMDANIKEEAYMSSIRPCMEYASSVWDPYKLGEIKEIEKVQRLAARRVLGKMRIWKTELN